MESCPPLYRESSSPTGSTPLLPARFTMTLHSLPCCQWARGHAPAGSGPHSLLSFQTSFAMLMLYKHSTHTNTLHQASDPEKPVRLLGKSRDGHPSIQAASYIQIKLFLSSRTAHTNISLPEKHGYSLSQCPQTLPLLALKLRH